MYVTEKKEEPASDNYSPGELRESGLQILFGRLAQRADLDDAAHLFDSATFLSLGSGEGHAVITTAAWFPVLRLGVGIERSGGKTRKAQATLMETEKAFEDLNIKSRVAFYHGDVELDLPKLLRPPYCLPADEYQTIVIWVNDRNWGAEMRDKVYKRLNDNCYKKADVWIFCCHGPSKNKAGFFTRRCVAWTEEGILTGVGWSTDIHCFRFLDDGRSNAGPFDWERWDRDLMGDAKCNAEELDGALGRRIRCGEPLVHLAPPQYDHNSIQNSAAAGTAHLAGPDWNENEHMLGDINNTVC